MSTTGNRRISSLDLKSHPTDARIPCINPTHAQGQPARTKQARMEVVVGCVGKPSVGKSTFFNAVTDGKVGGCGGFYVLAGRQAGMRAG